MLKFAGFLGTGLALSAIALEVRVVDTETGRPIEGATVVFSGRTNMTGAAGETTGSGSKLLAHKSGYVPIKISWESAVPQRAEIKLPPAETIGGRVVDRATNPVPGAAITVIVPGPLTGPRFALEDFSVTSDSDGRWRCDSVPKNPAYVRLEFTHPNFDWPEKEFSLAELRAQTAELKVAPVSTLTGRVVGPSGEPIAGAQVILGNDNFVQDEPDTRTDSAGKFAFARQPPQRRRLVGVRAQGWAPTLQFLNPTSALVEIRLDKGKPVRVRVEDHAGEPLPGVEANMTDLETADSRARWLFGLGYWRTDLQGTFVWSNAPAQPCTWNFSRDGYMGRSRLELRPANGEAVVRLGPPFTLTGTVVDATNGRPISEFILNARFIEPHLANALGTSQSGGGRWYDWTRQPFRDGKFSVYYEDPLLGGSEMHDWQFRVEADGYETFLSRVVRDYERGTNIVCQLTPRPPPRFKLEPPAGKTRVTAGIALQPPRLTQDEMFTVFIKAHVKEGHWIYALEDSGSENIPTSIAAPLPRGFEAEGEWRSPAPKIQPDESRTLSGELLFQRRYVVTSSAQPQTHKLRFKLEFQVCNDLVCWPPEAIDIEAELEIVKPR